MADPRSEAPKMSISSGDLELWFQEKSGVGLSSAMAMMVDGVITRFRSEFQEVVVLQTRGYGKMLVLDGVIMVTEFDETSYHEMITHVPLMCHPNPRQALVIGGGDGGAVREVLKHKSIERVVLCEIDKAVVDVCREHFPKVSCGLDDPRVEIVYQDGAKYVRDHPETFDVIMTDSSDPVGPAEVLFRRPFYEGLHSCLRQGGLAASQGESFFYHPHVIGPMFEFIEDVFPVTAYYVTHIPTYPSGLIGFAFCSKGPRPVAGVDFGRAAGLGELAYYSPAVHKAAFVLPPRALRIFPRRTRSLLEQMSA